jgi:hypothetical protein
MQRPTFGGDPFCHPAVLADGGRRLAGAGQRFALISARHLAQIWGTIRDPKTACRPQGGVLYTQLAKFAAFAVERGA